ncbi:MAG: hypothetical protein K0R65_789 [Crocinitomicaceae bacterium]|jgi:hypothetical protein|nr:hypothetical protein [Crocinitomicaceae bacterium]
MIKSNFRQNNLFFAGRIQEAKNDLVKALISLTGEKY